MCNVVFDMFERAVHGIRCRRHARANSLRTQNKWETSIHQNINIGADPHSSNAHSSNPLPTTAEGRGAGVQSWA